MTDQEIEMAAREYCRLHNLNPDEQIAHGADPGPGGIVTADILYSPRWQRVAREISYFATILDAIEFARRAK